MSSDFPPPGIANSFNSSDADLVSAVKTGQVDALGVLYDRYADAVYGLALKLLMHTEEAEDLTQEIFLSLRDRTNYNPSRGSLISYLMVMTRSRAIDKLRSRSTKFRVMQRWQGVLKTESSGSTPLERSMLSERAEAVQAAMAQLPETERQVLEIAYYEGFSQSEVAERLNLPLGTVKSRSRQGLIKLRRALENVID